MGEYEEPTYVTSDPHDVERLFVVEKAGRIMLTVGGRTSTFLDQREITSTYSERGLLSMAFAPDFGRTRRFYIFYTEFPGGALRVDELLARADVADPDSRRNVLTIPHPHWWHNGGQLHFGPDGYLYISTGDGGITHRNGQDLSTDRYWDTEDEARWRLGALLRIDPRQSGADPYTVPPDNPYVGTDNAVEIWSWGLRNPWRFSFDRETGALTIADVGGAKREEINYRPQDIGGGRDENFGWSCLEGFRSSLTLDECGYEGRSPFVDPVFDYEYGVGEPPACGIIGGYVVRDPSLGGLEGRYLYSDICTGELRSIVLDVPVAHDDCSEGVTLRYPSSFGEDAEGGIYVVSLEGPVSRLVGESERRDCRQATGPATTKLSMVPSFALPGSAVVLMTCALLLGVRPRIGSWQASWAETNPLIRRVRIAAAFIVAAGLAASWVAVLAEELGLGAAAAEGVFGWKRMTLLVAGGVGAAIGGAVLARPRIVSQLIDREETSPVIRRVRVAAALIVIAGLAASGVAILAEELGLAAGAIWGWKRIMLLIAGGVVAAIGTVLLARPRIASRRLASWGAE